MTDDQVPDARLLDQISQLGLSEIIRLQSLLQQELSQRFERHVLLVFSDIVDSTPYCARFGDAAGRQMQQHHIDLLERGIAPFTGRIVDTAGDGAFIVFADAQSAVLGVVATQRLVSQANLNRAKAHQLQLRTGLHWGAVLTDGAVVSGDCVNLCARVASSADAGEVRLTRDVFDELGSAERMQCRALGPVDLKGVGGAIEILALEWRDRGQFPTQLRVQETGELIDLPLSEIIKFGRLQEYEGRRANDVVLIHPDPLLARHVSRWHFELRRGGDGFRLRSLSDTGTKVNGDPALKGQDVPIKPGDQIRLARGLSLEVLPPPAQDGDDVGITVVGTVLQYMEPN